MSAFPYVITDKRPAVLILDDEDLAELEIQIDQLLRELEDGALVVSIGDCHYGGGRYFVTVILEQNHT